MEWGAASEETGSDELLLDQLRVTWTEQRFPASPFASNQVIIRCGENSLESAAAEN
jgi:hypothetical protein